MELQLFGINHKTTRLSKRELFIINDSNQEDFKNFILTTFQSSIESFFALSTCNRTEVYLYAEPLIAKQVMDQTAEFLGCSSVVEKDFYILEGVNAIEHMCSVASGLDSQVLGEQEILGQFKKSIQSFVELDVLDNTLKRITDEIISITKAVRTQTKIGYNALSISGLSYKIVKELFEDPLKQQVTIVGAGQNAFNVIENFYNNGITNISALNRSRKTIEISQSLSLKTISLNQLNLFIQRTDILVASISTSLPIIGKGLIEQSLRARKNKPILLIDLGVPRNIEDQVRELENAYLFTIEDMEFVSQDNLEERNEEAIKGLKLIKEKIKLFEPQILKRKDRNKAYKLLSEFCFEMDEEDIKSILKSDDPFLKLKCIIDKSDDRLKYLSNLGSHEISSMIKEINRA